MKKITTMGTAMAVILATMLFWQASQAAEKPTKEARAPESSPQRPAVSNATANAAKAFDTVSKELYPKAKQEGNLIVYSVWDVEHLKVITDAFMKTLSGNQGNLLAGAKPGNRHPCFDGVSGRPVELSMSYFPTMRRRSSEPPGAIMDLQHGAARRVVSPRPDIATVSLQIQALAYNTKKIKPADLPKSWEDVANPKYQGHGCAGRSDARRTAKFDARRPEDAVERRDPL